MISWFSNIPAKYRPLFKVLKFSPGNFSYYAESLTHKSASNEKGQNYERLEFLGDAILSAVISDHIFFNYPQEKEGGLSKLRSRAVNRKTLNQIGAAIQITKYLDCDTHLLNGESSIPGNCLEALMGAIYLDKGFQKSYKIIMSIMQNFADLEKILLEDTNYKSQLLEWGQKNKRSIEFKTEEVALHTFTAECLVDGKTFSKVKGKNKKASEQESAQITLQKLGLI